jgi:hypothetical protein
MWDQPPPHTHTLSSSETGALGLRVSASPLTQTLVFRAMADVRQCWSPSDPSRHTLPTPATVAHVPGHPVTSGLVGVWEKLPCHWGCSGTHS